MATIAWDCDDVLNDLMRCWLEQWWKPTHLECKIAFEDLKENPPHRILGIELQEYLDSLDAFRTSKQVREMKPLPEVLEWFEQHGRRHRHIVVSATTLECAPFSAEWTFRYFGKWVRSFHVIPTRTDEATMRYHTNKAGYLRWLGKADILVDDSTHNIKALNSTDLLGVLFPRPWNNRRVSREQALERLESVLSPIAG